MTDFVPLYRGVSAQLSKCRIVIVERGNMMRIPKIRADAGKIISDNMVTLVLQHPLDFSVEPTFETGQKLGSLIAQRLEAEGVDMSSFNTIIGIRAVERTEDDLTPYRFAWGQTFEVHP